VVAYGLNHLWRPGGWTPARVEKPQVVA